MKSFRLALLAAAVLAVAPAIAQNGNPDGNWRRGGDGVPRGDGGNRPAPPQAQIPQAQIRPAPAPQANQPRPAAPAAQEQQRGNWGGGARAMDQSGDQRARWAGNRAQWDRGNSQPAAEAGNPDRRDRGSWSPRDGAALNRSEGQQRGDARTNGQRDFGNAQWNRNDQRDRNDRNGQWNRDGRNVGGRHWDNNNNYRGDSRQWTGNRYGNNDHRPETGWRNDRRYDWRGWRDTHSDIFQRGRYYAPHGYGYRSVYRGFLLEPFFYSSNYWLADPYEYRLPPVEWPYRWVRYYDDALLVDTTSGEVVDVIQSFFF